MAKRKDDQNEWHVVPKPRDKSDLKFCMEEAGYATISDAIRGALRSHARGLKRKKTLAVHRAQRAAKASTGEQV